jgi:hypothetical protein
VAVLPSAITWRRGPLARQLRLLASATGMIRPLPAGSFRNAGTDIDTVYVSFTRPGLAPRRTRRDLAAQPALAPLAAGAWVQEGIF